MDPFRQVDQRLAGPVAPFADERVLGDHCTLDAAVVVRDERRGRKAQRPFDLDPAMVVAPVVAIDQQRDPLRTEGELALQQAQCGACVPEPN